jgi:hypothetical protein
MAALVADCLDVESVSGTIKQTARPSHAAEPTSLPPGRTLPRPRGDSPGYPYRMATRTVMNCRVQPGRFLRCIRKPPACTTAAPRKRQVRTTVLCGVHRPRTDQAIRAG